MTRRNKAKQIREWHAKGNAFDRMESGEQAPVSKKKAKKPRRIWKRKRAATLQQSKDAG